MATAAATSSQPPPDHPQHTLLPHHEEPWPPLLPRLPSHHQTTLNTPCFPTTRSHGHRCCHVFPATTRPPSTHLASPPRGAMATAAATSSQPPPDPPQHTLLPRHEE